MPFREPGAPEVARHAHGGGPDERENPFQSQKSRSSRRCRRRSGSIRCSPSWSHIRTKGSCCWIPDLHHSFAERKFGNFGKFLGIDGPGEDRAGKGRMQSTENHRGSAPTTCGTSCCRIFISTIRAGCRTSRDCRTSRCTWTREELEAARAPFSLFKGYVKNHIEGVDLLPIPYGDGAPPFPRACDFFGDGSVLVVRTSGTHERTLVGPVERGGRADPADLRRRSPQVES